MRGDGRRLQWERQCVLQQRGGHRPLAPLRAQDGRGVPAPLVFPDAHIEPLLDPVPSNAHIIRVYYTYTYKIHVHVHVL